MAAPIPTGSSLSALPVAPTINPMMGVVDTDPLGSMEKGMDFGAKFARLGQLKQKLELEDLQRKADMAKAKAATVEADLLQRHLEDQFNLEQERKRAELANTITAGKLAGVTLGEAQDTAGFNQELRAAARGQLGSLRGVPSPTSDVPVSTPTDGGSIPAGTPVPTTLDGAVPVVAVPFAPNAKFNDWIKPQVAAKILETRRPVMSVSALAKELGVKQEVRPFVDANTGAKYEADVLTGPAGEIFKVSAPRFVAPSPLQGAVDKQTADDISEFNNGGREKALAQIAKLDGVIKTLRDPGTIAASGPIVSLLPERLVDTFSSDKTLGVKKDIRQVVQLSLKAILGSQFTEKEGERMFDAAFGKAMSEPANADRVAVMKGELERLLAAKTAQVDYFRKHGTLSGFNPIGGAPSVSPGLENVSPAAAGAEIRVDPRTGKKYRLVNGVVTEVGG